MKRYLKSVGVAREGRYVAKIVSTDYLGPKVMYGRTREMVQRFVFRVVDEGRRFDIPERFPMTFDERSNFHDLLVALGLDVKKLEHDGWVDPETFVGKKINVRVFDTLKHSNVKCLPPTPELTLPTPELDAPDPEPDPEPVSTPRVIVSRNDTKPVSKPTDCTFVYPVSGRCSRNAMDGGDRCALHQREVQ